MRVTDKNDFSTTSEQLGSLEKTQSAQSLDVYPRVSIVIPTIRAELCAKAIESLYNQVYKGSIEIIVVGEPADEMALHWSIVPVNHGLIRDPGKARNLGASYATGEILLFLDDDCTAKKDWVEQNVKMLLQPDIGAVGGCIRCNSNTFFARSTDFTNFGYYQHASSADGPLAAASLGMRRSVFQDVGGFDEHMHYGEEEDIDLCYRIQLRGYRTVYEPGIVVFHDHRRDTLAKLLQYNYKHGQSSGLTTKIKYRDLSLKNRLLANVRFPLVFLCLLPFIAISATLNIVRANIRKHWDVLLHVPFILLAKFLFEFGIFLWLLRNQAKVNEMLAVPSHS